MQVGLMAPQGWKGEYDGWSAAAAWDRTVELARQAEALGFESLWVFDHFHTVPQPTDEFLIQVGGPSQQAAYTSEKYLSLIALMIVAFGLSFEFPIVLVFLLIARVITTAQLRRARRWAIVGIVTFAAVITPSQDPYSLFFMAVPMYLFYEASIIIGRILKR